MSSMAWKDKCQTWMIETKCWGSWDFSFNHSILGEGGEGLHNQSSGMCLCSQWLENCCDCIKLASPCDCKTRICCNHSFSPLCKIRITQLVPFQSNAIEKLYKLWLHRISVTFWLQNKNLLHSFCSPLQNKNNTISPFLKQCNWKLV